MDPHALHDLEADVHAETAACIARVQALIDRARESGASIDPDTEREFAVAVADAGHDVERAILRAADALQEQIDDNDGGRFMASRRRDALAYRS